jgi:hypothetical protein
MKSLNMFFCLNKKDKFGNDVQLELYGDFNSITRALTMIYRPCSPKIRTEFNQNETCLVDDFSDETLQKKLEESRKYVS